MGKLEFDHSMKPLTLKARARTLIRFAGGDRSAAWSMANGLQAHLHEVWCDAMSRGGTETEQNNAHRAWMVAEALTRAVLAA